MVPTEAGLRSMRRWIALLCGLVLALLVACGVLLSGLASPGGDGVALERLRNDSEVRRAVIAELVRDSTSIFDSHPDPQVGRILQPGLEGVPYKGIEVETNSFGLRELEFEIPKPAGVVRIVVLGDSFVFGNGVLAEERMGAHLLESLEQRRGVHGVAIECLHLGIESWNAVAESAYLRRQLSEIEPDLIAHLLVSNDIDDNMSVRGFGTLAEQDVRHPQHVGVRVAVSYPTRLLGRGWNHLNEGLDWESRHRLEELASAVAGLQRAAGAARVPYVCLANWSAGNAVLRPYLEDVLPEDSLVCLPGGYVAERKYWVSATDQHWNSDGHRRFARLLYGLILERGLLPQLELADWPEARELARGTLARGARQARERSAPEPEVRSSLEFSEPGLDEMQHVHTGIDLAGRVAPYASLVLSLPPAARHLQLEGRFLQAQELAGAHIRVFLDDLLTGELVVEPGAGFRERWALPAEVLGRRHVSVRFLADDWVITGADRRRCESFEFGRVGFSED